jgi:hypothetical protein
MLAVEELENLLAESESNTLAQQLLQQTLAELPIKSLTLAQLPKEVSASFIRAQLAL